MVKFSLSEAAKAVSGTLCNVDGTKDVISVTTDSRNVGENSLFAALKGEFFDGHKFAKGAVSAGSVCVLSHEDLGELPHIRVKDTKYALLGLAKWYLEQFNVTVIGITGSAGKTTTKDMVADILSKKFNIVKTEGNFNNEVGLPLTVFRIDKSTEIAVLEMGMNQFGEIHNLSKVGTPEVCIMTNIGDAHIGNLGSREGILKAKSEIFDFADEKAIAILNGDDVLLNKISPKVDKILYYGMDKSAFCSFEKLEDLGLRGTSWRIAVNDESFTVKISLPGDYLAYNAAAAICAGKHFGVSNQDIAAALENFKPSKNRMNIFEIEGTNVTVINDVYNASPPSMRAMIDSIRHENCRKICVFGDMLELGEQSADYHEEIGKYAADAKIDMLFLYGEFSKDYEKGFKQKSNQNVFCINELDTLISKLKVTIRPEDIVLIKASRGMKFERIIEELKK
ncbi:MAG: UDP-N-acetylmuramoyl-tripeptide--D-alanyl-D-alanine ligase [Defluviitaleaceae bacterium]|nr:UDP-N-acetylmuramoyl-tripeptide--D-alanyl-D-alanine ligase [Defluviitaleaceae bacterium]